MTAIGFRRRGADRGAAAVEFALVTPLLLVMLFGIIDYGIWFTDSIALRQAVRDGARRGAVENFGSCSPAITGTTDADLHNLACSVASGVNPISGTVAVRVVIANDPASASGAAWQAGRTLRVCALSQHTSLLPFVPFPSGGISKASVDIPIEQASAAGAGTRTGYAGDPAPAGANWLWCR
jgi:Flp pilus assembly protein TadG